MQYRFVIPIFLRVTVELSPIALQAFVLTCVSHAVFEIVSAIFLVAYTGGLANLTITLVLVLRFLSRLGSRNRLVLLCSRRLMHSSSIHVELNGQSPDPT